jgi:hypothetical protein
VLELIKLLIPTNANRSDYNLSDNTLPRSHRYLSWFTLAALTALASYYYLERVAYLDLAYHVFTYLRTGELFIQNQRFGSALTQAVPLLALKAGLPLDAVLWFYSVTFPLLAIGVFALSTYWLRNDRAALAVPLLGTLLVSYLFFWAQSELQQALLWLLLYWAILGATPHVGLNKRSALLAALVPVLTYFHPLLLIAFGFVWGYDWLLRPQRRIQWLNYGLLLGAVLLYRWRVKHVASGSYDAQRMNVDALRQQLPDLFSLPGVNHFLQLLGGELILVPIGLLLLTGFYCWKARRRPEVLLRLAWVMAFCIGYSILVCLAYPNGGEHTYLSNLYQLLALFLILPFTTEVVPEAGLGTQVGAWAMGAFFGVRLTAIVVASAPFVAYLQRVERLITYVRQFPESRFLAAEANWDAQHLTAPSWASSYETLLLSARHGADSARVIAYVENPDALGWGLRNDSTMLLRHETPPLREMPTRYVRLRPGPTRLLTTPAPTDTAVLHQLIREAGPQIQLAVLSPPTAPVEAGTALVLPVQLKTPSDVLIPAGFQGSYSTAITYRFWRGDWPQLRLTAPLIPLEVDVTGTWQQPVAVQLPLIRGVYELEMQLVSRGWGAWPIQTRRIPIQVR